MAYTETTNTPASYNEDKKNITTWDAAWDVTGNVAITFWDINPTEYTNETGNTPVYVEQ